MVSLPQEVQVTKTDLDLTEMTSLPQEVLVTDTDLAEMMLHCTALHLRIKSLYLHPIIANMMNLMRWLLHQ